VLETFRLNRLLLDLGDELTRPVGLSSARWQVLGVVEHGPVPVAHVAREMGLTRQSVQQTADSLEHEGLISFEENPHHRRAKLMRITPRGRMALDYVQEQHAEWANNVGWEFGEERLRTMLAGLSDLSRTLNPDLADACPPDEAD
jgi:DNA-binding MarR family transcriptional regulator